MPDPRQTTLPLDDLVPETAMMLLPDAAEAVRCICALLLRIVEDEQHEEAQEEVPHEPNS